MQEEELSVKNILLENFKNKMSEQRAGIHLSDLLHCCKVVAFNKLDMTPPSKRKINESQAYKITSGIAYHKYLPELLGDEFEYEKEIVYVTKNGTRIIAHPDAIHKSKDCILELKTTKSIQVQDKPYSYHLKQLLYYLAITNFKKGILLYVLDSAAHISHNFIEYHVEMNEAQRRYTLYRIDREADKLQKSIEMKDPSLASDIAGNVTYHTIGGDSWMCESCPFRKICPPYQRRYKMTWTEEDDLQKLQRDFEQLREDFRIFFPHS